VRGNRCGARFPPLKHNHSPPTTPPGRHIFFGFALPTSKKNQTGIGGPPFGGGGGGRPGRVVSNRVRARPVKKKTGLGAAVLRRGGGAKKKPPPRVGGGKRTTNKQTRWKDITPGHAQHTLFSGGGTGGGGPRGASPVGLRWPKIRPTPPGLHKARFGIAAAGPRSGALAPGAATKPPKRASTFKKQKRGAPKLGPRGAVVMDPDQKGRCFGPGALLFALLGPKKPRGLLPGEKKGGPVGHFPKKGARVRPQPERGRGPWGRQKKTIWSTDRFSIKGGGGLTAG